MKIRTPAELADQINSLNCHARGGGYGPVTERQMQDIYAEARKMEWTDKRPDRVGQWCVKSPKENEGRVVKVWDCDGVLIGEMGYRINGNVYKGCQWSTRPIDMPEVKK